MINATTQELLALKEQLEQQYSGSVWFKGISSSSDDGGVHLEFRITDMKEAQKDGLSLHFKDARVLFISLGKDKVVRA